MTMYIGLLYRLPVASVAVHSAGLICYEVHRNITTSKIMNAM